MSNWLYANQVPTVKWRNAMTIPRDLRLAQSKDGIVIASTVAPEVNAIGGKAAALNNIAVNKTVDLSSKVAGLKSQYILKLTAAQLKGYTIRLSNKKDEEVLIGYDSAKGEYFIDRTESGKTDFEKSFAGRFTAPRFTAAKNSDLVLVVDKASVELFADGGLTTMTAVYFPNEDFNGLSVQSKDGLTLKKLSITSLRSIWK